MAKRSGRYDPTLHLQCNSAQLSIWQGQGKQSRQLATESLLHQTGVDITVKSFISQTMVHCLTWPGLTFKALVRSVPSLCVLSETMTPVYNSGTSRLKLKPRL